MSKKREPKYKVLDIYEFGHRMLETGDLDPVYSILKRSGFDRDFLKRWTLAYLCYYHCGVASFVASKTGVDFWARLRQAHEEKWPRGSERRHFRGGTSDYVTKWLPSEYERPEDAINYIIGKKSPPRCFSSVSDRVRSWKYFGPWVAFKVPDLLERVLDIPVDFSDCHLNLYDSPRKASELFAESIQRPGSSVKWVVSHLEDHFKGYLAPPSNDRPVNVQEVETILCKWGSHVKGHYPVGKDTVEIYEALEGWGKKATHLRSLLDISHELFQVNHT